MATTTQAPLKPMKRLLFPEDGDPKLSTYTIIDGAACEGLLEKIAEHDLDFCCLYAGELEPDVEEVAPYLIRLEADHQFTTWLLDSIGNKPWGIFCKASSTLRELRKHFRQFLLVKGPDGENLYFRYYDPRVLATFLPTCEPEEIEDFFGAIDHYYAAPGNAPAHFYRHRDGALKASEI